MPLQRNTQVHSWIMPKNLTHIERRRFTQYRVWALSQSILDGLSTGQKMQSSPWLWGKVFKVSVHSTIFWHDCTTFIYNIYALWAISRSSQCLNPALIYFVYFLHNIGGHLECLFFNRCLYIEWNYRLASYEPDLSRRWVEWRRLIDRSYRSFCNIKHTTNRWQASQNTKTKAHNDPNN